MRIDLHLHSPHSRQNGDAIKWISLYDSIEKLLINDIKIASFSDHNIFNVEFYKEAKELAKTANILLLPAIEANVVRSDGNIANVIYVFDDKLNDEQLNTISNIAKKYIPKKGIALESVNKIFSEFETLIIPHVGKSDYFKYEDLKMINYDAIEISSKTNSNYLIVSKKNDIKTSIVAFSDTHKWNEYPQVRKLITEIDGCKQSFNSLKENLLKNKDYSKERI